MLAGLLFAIHDAEDRPDRLAATLPFAGTTLIEYQARLLIAAGASQIVVVVAKLTPDLLGAMSRIGRRGVAVDAVRNAGEAAEKLHPLARVLVLADGLVTTEAVVRQLSGEGAPALLVVNEEDAGPADELIGGHVAWAGVARLGHAQVRDVAAMPRDYDLQSALLRAASQGGAAHLLLPASAGAEEHGIEHRAAALDARSRGALSAAVADRRQGWFDRWIVAPLGRFAVPRLVTRGVPSIAVAFAAALAGLGGLAALYTDWIVSGLAACFASTVGWSLAATLSRLRDEAATARLSEGATIALPALAALLLGGRLSAVAGESTALVLAIGLIVLAGLAERAISGRTRLLLWGSPGGYLLLTTLVAAAGWPSLGLALAALYAAATAGAAVEMLRRQA